jgi:hypothetical protein
LGRVQERRAATAQEELAQEELAQEELARGGLG